MAQKLRRKIQKPDIRSSIGKTSDTNSCILHYVLIFFIRIHVLILSASEMTANLYYCVDLLSIVGSAPQGQTWIDSPSSFQKSLANEGKFCKPTSANNCGTVEREACKKRKRISTKSLTSSSPKVITVCPRSSDPFKYCVTQKLPQIYTANHTTSQ